jgi:hypothetical protein
VDESHCHQRAERSERQVRERQCGEDDGAEYEERPAAENI